MRHGQATTGIKLATSPDSVVMHTYFKPLARLLQAWQMVHLAIMEDQKHGYCHRGKSHMLQNGLEDHGSEIARSCTPLRIKNVCQRTNPCRNAVSYAKGGEHL